MKRENQAKKPIYKGVFISNERKKKQGGRIKCPDFPNKIEVYGLNQALHESEVEWQELRRYKRQPKDKRAPKRQEPTKSSKSKDNEPSQKNAPPKNLKYKEKEETIKKQNKQSQKVESVIENSATITSESYKPNKKHKYKLKTKETNNQSSGTIAASEEKAVATVKQQEASEGQEVTQKIQDIYTEEDIVQGNLSKEKEGGYTETPQNRAENEQKGSDSEQESNEESFKDLEIIVAKIKRETNIVYKTKPFVAIMDFFKKRGQGNKKKKARDDPIEQILEDFNVDIVPIHARLPRMEMDQLIDQNITILSDYAQQVLNYDKNKKRKEQLNRIIDSLSNTYIFVTFSDWDGDYPLAKIHKILGKALTISGECERFLYQHGLNDFHYEEESAAGKGPLQLQPTALHQKIDRMVFTIDPATSTDLDDALSIEAKGELYEIGIHIADVSSYLHLINRQEIVRRTTSVYLPYKVYHMLESHLVKVCSLDPGLFRLAFTVWVTMDTQGNVIGEGRLSKNIVQSRFKLSYEVVQNIITGKMNYEEFKQKHPCSEAQFESLLQKLLALAEIAQAHRQKRVLFDVFENREMEFRTDESSWPIQCFIDKRFAAKKIVEEYMIIGNIESARYLVRHQPLNSLVIHHPKPSKLSVASFNEQFKSLETKFKFEDVVSVQRQLQQLQQNEQVSKQIKQICFFRARRIMEPAIYRKYHEILQENEEKAKDKSKNKEDKQELNHQVQEYPAVHFALGLQFYTHFTSPMRRMADVLVHQVLTQVLQGKEPLPIEPTEIEKINNGRRSTKRLKKDLNEVYLCLMIHRTKMPLETEGVISSFGMESVSIYIPLFDMQKQILWKKEFKIHSIQRIKGKEDRMDVKLKHDKQSSKGDVYWIMKKFEKVKLTLGCTKSAPLLLTVEMQVESEKGPFRVEWVE